MPKRDFFILIVKLFGLYSVVVGVFLIMPNSFSYLQYALIEPTLFISLALVIIFMIVLMYFLINKAGKIVDLLKIEQGFESEEFNLGALKEASIVKIAIIILGGYIFLDSIPAFIRSTLDMVNETEFIDYDGIENYAWVTSLVRLFIGLFLTFNYKPVQQFILKERG